GKFHYKCLHYRHSVNSKQYAKEQAELAETNVLHMNRRDDGSFFLTGFLDPIGGAVVRSALEPLARTLGKDDHRPRPQRMADALVELAGHQQTIQMQVTSSIETLLDLTGAPGAESEFSLPISAKTVERWACDCSLTRVLMQDSLVTDVGRAKRIVSAPLMRTLKGRDQHCRWPRRSDRHGRAIFPIHGEVPAVGGGWGLPLLRSDDRQLLPAQAPLITFVQRMKAASLAQ